MLTTCLFQVILLSHFGAFQTHALPPPPNTFHIQNDTFYYNQQPIQIKSGSIHYSRVPRAYWADRLQRMHAMGLNAVQTYVMWNYHETYRGVFDFTKDKDLSAFLQACQDEGLLVLLRLGPYSCGEWEFGGFPAWMINHQPPVTLRTFEKGYISLVDTWWSRLLPVVKPHLISNGGSVVMVQVENEFGSYGDVSTQPNDLKYMHHLVALVRSYLGPAPQIYTTDGGNVGYMSRGTLNGSIVYTVGDHGPSSDVGNCQAMKEYNAPGLSPCMDSEFYTGWLTHWGDAALANTSSAVAAQWIDALLTNKGNLNMYMGHGGTSFGYWSGSNGDGGTVFQPDVTSYDYDSPVSEGGEHGYGNDGLDKYKAIQTVLLKHRTRSNSIFKEPSPVPKEPSLPRRVAYPSLAFSESTRLLPNALVLLPNASGGKPVATTDRTSPPSMEAIGQNYGFLLYETTMPPTTRAGDNEGEFPTMGFSTFPRDRAHVFVDSQVATTTPLYRSTYNKSVPLLIQTGTTLQILIENMGRLNYGTGMYDPKGIAQEEHLLWNGQTIPARNWTTYSLPLEYAQLQNLRWQTLQQQEVHGVLFEGPTFYRATMNVSIAADTYATPKGWGKGMIWVNGFNLGRYWESMGPQHGLFVPAHVWKTGENEIILLELDQGSASLELSFAVSF